uniref:Uncharacterized protein n=1 Tax=Rhizophora mucronata TaxID=61149 RepID=A0A2P2NDV6_RHIMU
MAVLYLTLPFKSGMQIVQHY